MTDLLCAEQLTYWPAPTAPAICRNLGFVWPAGHRVVGLAGPSGSGKTTLARLLAGHRTGQSGAVRVGRRVQPIPGANPVQLALQNPELSLDPRWTVRQILHNGGTPDPQVLAALGIRREWSDRRPSELSGGEMQRVAVGRLLLPTTQYLICDEVTASLDAIAQADFWEALLSATRQMECRVLVISHDVFLLERICSTVLNIDDLVG